MVLYSVKHFVTLVLKGAIEITFFIIIILAFVQISFISFSHKLTLTFVFLNLGYPLPTAHFVYIVNSLQCVLVYSCQKEGYSRAPSCENEQLSSALIVG